MAEKKAMKKTKLDELWDAIEKARKKFDAIKAAKISAHSALQKLDDGLAAASEELNKALAELRDHEKKLKQKDEP